MRKKLTVFIIALFVLGVSFTIVPKKANAIPSFAQKYHFSCAVCHTVFPNLNPFGRAFWRNGFRLPGTNMTPMDATQITQGLSLPNPWPIPVMIEPIISYQHYTNENVSNATDAVSAEFDFVTAGAFKIYTPLANSISFYVHANTAVTSSNPSQSIRQKQVFASINGLGSGYGIPSHLLNLKIGNITTASPYFYRQIPFYVSAGAVGNGQGMTVGYGGEAGALIHSRNPGFGLYGTPGYHLWYKVTVTNDTGSPNSNYATNGEALQGGTTSNAMEYSYQLKEYMNVPVGQLEYGYYGATINEPLIATATQNSNTAIGDSWTNRIQVNGLDIDLANDIYELGVTFMQQRDSQPYGPQGIAYNNTTQTSNGYNDLEFYGRYLFSNVGNGLMLMADYATYSWIHKGPQEMFLNGSPYINSNLYPSSYLGNDGIDNALALQAEYNLAYNAHWYLAYVFTNHNPDNVLGTGLDFAF